MHMLLLALFTSALAASIDFRDVSDQFDESLEKMLENLKGSEYEMASIGAFPGGGTWIQDARLGNFGTIMRASQVALVTVGERLSVEGGLSLGEMLIVGSEDGTANNTHKIIVRENLWNYNFWVSSESKDCNEGVVVLLTDLGEMKLIFDKGELVEELDVTRWIKPRMDEPTWQRVSAAVAEVFHRHFDFCNVLKN